MRVALVDNGTTGLQNLLEMLSGHDVELFPFEDADQILSLPFDCIVLSGGSRFSVMSNLDILAGELRLIRESSIPLLGICFGCELIAVAFGGTLRETPNKRQGVFDIRWTIETSFFPSHKSFRAFEAHRWVLDSVPSPLLTLAMSESGPEVIRHDSRPIVGFQFHPEKKPSETDGVQLFEAFLIFTSLSPASTVADS